MKHSIEKWLRICGALQAFEKQLEFPALPSAACLVPRWVQNDQLSLTHGSRVRPFVSAVLFQLKIVQKGDQIGDLFAREFAIELVTELREDCFQISGPAIVKVRGVLTDSTQ